VRTGGEGSSKPAICGRQTLGEGQGSGVSGNTTRVLCRGKKRAPSTVAELRASQRGV